MPLLVKATKKILGFVDGKPSDEELTAVDELFRQSSSFTNTGKQQQQQPKN